MNTVFHTSDCIVENPRVEFSRKYLDFGEGFYLTPRREQAVNYGERFKKMRKSPVLNMYRLDELPAECLYKRFEAYDEEWLDYIAQCRKGLPHARYDVVEGGIANDNVFDTINLYTGGLIDKSEALRRLQYQKPNWQICICSQQVLDSCLHFVASEKL